MSDVETPSPTRYPPRGKRIYEPGTIFGDTTTANFFVYPAYHENANPGIYSIYALDQRYVVVLGTVGSGLTPTLNIWDLADPANAVRVASLTWPGTNPESNTDKLCIVGDYVLCINSTPSPDTLLIFDCSDRANPFLAATISDDMFDRAECLTVNPLTGIGAVVGNHFPAQLGVFDASALLAGNPNMVLIGAFQSTSYDSGAFVQWFDNSINHDRLIITTFNNQVHAVNMTNPFSPTIYSSITNTTYTGGVEYLAIRADHQYAYTSTSTAISKWSLTGTTLAVSQFFDTIGTDRLFQMVSQAASDGRHYLYATTRKTGGAWLSRYDVTNNGSPTLREAAASPRIGPYGLCVPRDALAIVGGGWPIGTPSTDARDWFVPVQYTDI